MRVPQIRVLAVLLVCITASVGCNQANNADVSKAQADAEAARAEAKAARDELDKSTAELNALKAELATLNATKAAATDERDRKAAEWVLRVGGIVHIVDEGVNRILPKEGTLPETPFKVTYVNLAEPEVQGKLTNDGVKFLEGLKHLKHLQMDLTGVDDFSFVKGMDSLEVFLAAFTDAGLSHLKTLPRIKILQVGAFFGNANITDVGLAHIKELRNLERLDLSGTQITDAGLENLANLNKLQFLDLFRTPISDVGLQHLKGLTELRELNMASTLVTGPGAEHLKGLPKLASINLQTTKFTDAGLEHFKGLSNLAGLNVYDTNVTDDGVKALKAALPNCNISVK